MKNIGGKFNWVIMWKSLINGLQQIAGYFTAEIKECFRDSGTIVIFILGMITYPVAYSIGYLKETVRDVPVAVVDLDHTSLSRQYSRMADATEQVNVVFKPASLKAASDLFYKGKVAGVILIPSGFEKDIYSGRQAGITVYSDAGHFLLYKQVYAGGIYSSQTFGAGIEVKSLLMKGETLNQALKERNPLNVSVYNLYNPSGGYATFIVPGIFLIVIQQTLLIGIGLLGGKHNERNSYHYLAAAIHQRWASLKLVLGQAGAYVFIYLFTSFLIVGIFYKLILFPDKGGYLSTYYLLVPYLFTIAFLGITIGLLFKKRAHALLLIVFISPSVFFMSGVAWPAQALPPILRYLSFLFPSTPMINAFVRLRMMGSGLHAIRFEYHIMLIQMVICFILALLSFQIKLKRLRRQVALPVLVVTSGK
jgi:ABC-2 type transport system permease protein